MKNLIILFCFVASISNAQIQSVDYFMRYNNVTNQYDVSLIIVEGSTSELLHRAQYNSTISIAVPTGESLEVTDRYMPLQNNQDLTGTVGSKWSPISQVSSPASSPTNDFYHITPILSPSAFYNDLNEGDEVPLFSFTVGNTGEFIEGVRFFDNVNDPNSLREGMVGGDFSNVFKIGDCINIFNSSSEEFNTTDIEETASFAMNAFPNPFQNQLTLNIPENTEKVSIMGLDGKVYYSTKPANTQSITANTSQFPSGVYFCKISGNSGTFSSMRIIKL